MEQRYPKPDINLAKRLNKISVVLTIVVLITVGLMRRVKFDVGIDFSFLPPVSATLVLLLLMYPEMKDELLVRQSEEWRGR